MAILGCKHYNGLLSDSLFFKRVYTVVLIGGNSLHALLQLKKLRPRK